MGRRTIGCLLLLLLVAIAAPALAAKTALNKPVNRVIVGLYASTRDLPSGWKLTHAPHPDPLFSGLTMQHAKSRKSASFNRRYDPESRELNLIHSSLGGDELGEGGAPHWVDATKPLVRGKGVPTVVWATLHQMNRLGIAYGSLRALRTIVGNARSEFVIDPVHGLSTMDALRATSTFRYASAIAMQSGHRIVGVEVAHKSPEQLDAQSQAHPTTLTGYELVLRLAPL